MHAEAPVLCVGELLWDSLPDGRHLGGAPFNVAAHLHALGVPAAMLSRVGSDALGDEARAQVARHGIATDLIQVDESLPTGIVSVALDEHGVPSYEVASPAAWDAIEMFADLRRRARAAQAIVFGSLAQRSPTSRATIQQLCALNRLRVFDVNLRPPYDDVEAVRASLEIARVVKLNEQELRQISGWFGLPEQLQEAASALEEAFSCETVCITRGSHGAALLRGARWSTHPGFQVDAVDTVGSGDAFLAAFLRGYLDGLDDERLLTQANLLGAFVATRPGAIPPLDESLLARLHRADPPTGEPGAGRSPGLSAGEGYPPQ